MRRRMRAIQQGFDAVDNVETAGEMYRLFKQRDDEGVRKLFDPEIEWIQMDGFPGFREEWEGWRAVVETFLDAGESVVALGFYEGTYISTGRFARAEFAHILDFKGGRITRFVQYTDTFKVAEAMGVVEGGE